MSVCLVVMMMRLERKNAGKGKSADSLICHPGTYGGHLELTAFARLKKRSVKVVLPDVSLRFRYLSAQQSGCYSEWDNNVVDKRRS